MKSTLNYRMLRIRNNTYQFRFSFVTRVPGGMRGLGESSFRPNIPTGAGKYLNGANGHKQTDRRTDTPWKGKLCRVCVYVTEEKKEERSGLNGAECILSIMVKAECSWKCKGKVTEE